MGERPLSDRSQGLGRSSRAAVISVLQLTAGAPGANVATLSAHVPAACRSPHSSHRASLAGRDLLPSGWAPWRVERAPARPPVARASDALLVDSGVEGV